MKYFRDSVAKIPAKGYQAILAIGLEMDGQDYKMKNRERWKGTGIAGGRGDGGQHVGDVKHSSLTR